MKAIKIIAVLIVCLGVVQSVSAQMTKEEVKSIVEKADVQNLTGGIDFLYHVTGKFDNCAKTAKITDNTGSFTIEGKTYIMAVPYNRIKRIEVTKGVAIRFYILD